MEYRYPTLTKELVVNNKAYLPINKGQTSCPPVSARLRSSPDSTLFLADLPAASTSLLTSLRVNTKRVESGETPTRGGNGLSQKRDKPEELPKLLGGVLEGICAKEKGTEPDGQSPWVAEPRWEFQTHRPKALQTYAVANANMTIQRHCTHAIKHSRQNSLQLWHFPHNNLVAISFTFSMNYLLSGKEGRPVTWHAIFDQKQPRDRLNDELIVSYIINFVKYIKELHRDF